MSDIGAASLRGAVDLTSLVRRANSPAGTEAADGSVIVVDDTNFNRIVELSKTVPVIVEFIDPRLPGSGLDAILAGYGGRFVLARVDALANPQLVQAFQVQQVPLVAAVIAGRPLPLFAGALPEAELKDVLDQVLQVAEQQGVSGTVGEPGEEPAAPALPPLHQAAYDAIETGDYAAAITAYEQAIRENPRDADAVAGLAQVRLLARLGDDADEADRAFSVGDVDAAFALLLAAFDAGDAEARDLARTRLLEYFEILGDDPRVGPARRALTSRLL